MTIISSWDVNIYTKKCIYTIQYVCSTAIALKRHQLIGESIPCSITVRQCEANRNTVDPLLGYRGHPSTMATHLIHYYIITDYTLISLLPKPTSLMLPSLLGSRSDHYVRTDSFLATNLMHCEIRKEHDQVLLHTDYQPSVSLVTTADYFDMVTHLEVFL